MNFRSVVLILVSAKVLLHVLVLIFGGYGIFRDELYYMANTDHPAWGYVDHPPLSIWVLDAFTTLFGDAWYTIRLLSALAGGAAMWAVLRLVRTLGGNIVACWLAGIAFLFAPINLAFSSVYSMNVLELFFWPMALILLLKAINDPENTTRWLWLGAVTGLGMMNKISMAWFAIGMVVFLLVTPYRTLLRMKGPWLAGGVALILFLPFIIWNLTHDMAHLEFAMNASQNKYAGISRADFLSGQILLEHPHILVFIVASLLLLFSGRSSWKERMPVIIFFTALVILLLKGQVKSEYMASSYTGIMACGAIYLSNSRMLWKRRLLAAFVIFYIISGLALLPLAAPLLPEESFIRYNAALGIGPENAESKEEGLLPQFYADMHGWENFARTISEAYVQLPEEDRENVVAWVNNYGEAGAIDYYRDKYPLPPVLSRHNAYYFWGLETLEDRNFEMLLIVGGTAEMHGEYLNRVEEVAVISCTYCMPYENNLPVFLAGDGKPGLDIREVFEADKNFD